MMKEIRQYRGQRVDNQEWVYGCYAEFVNYLDGETKPGIQVTKQVPSSIDRMIPAWETELIEVIPETVGQYTGLKDKNGKEVYEGDILSVWRDGSNRKFAVKWRDTGTPMYILYPQPINENFWDCRSDMEKAWEIIGNIHENSELLRGE